MLELAPRVNLRPPATTKDKSKENCPPIHESDHSSIDIDAFLSDEDNEILQPGFTLSTPTSEDEVRPKTTPVPMETESKSKLSDRLLALRKDYKKTSVALAKADAHLNFTSSYQNSKKTPKGLRINVRCSAFLADQTNINHQFTETTEKAEQGYIKHLNTHYEKITTQLSQKKSLLQTTMNSLQTQATEQEKTTHLDMIEKTDNNVEKLSYEIGKRKRNKLSNISQPNPKRRRREETPTTTGATRNHETPLDQWTRPMVSHHTTQFSTPQLQPMQPTPALQPLLNMTLADILTGLQSPIQPPQIVAPCTPGNVRPPTLVHPGVGGLGRPPQLPQTAQQELGLYHTPPTGARPPRPTRPTRPNHGRRGRLPTQHPR